MLFVGTDLHETPIPFVVCRHRPTRDIDPKNYLLCRNQPTYKFFICISLIDLLATSNFTKYSMRSLLLLSPDLLCTHYLCFHQINSSLTPYSFVKNSRCSLLVYFSLPSLYLLTSTSALDLPLLFLFYRMPDLFARTPDLIFANI
jgi:hypothetical protein